MQCAALLDLRDVRRPRIEVVHDFRGPGYARPTPQAVEMKRRFAETGIDLDLSYTAKTAAAWWARKTANALLWLTYGRPRHAARAEGRDPLLGGYFPWRPPLH